MKRYLYILLALIINVQATAQNKASYTYDANNQLTQVVYANGTTVKYTYDALGNRLSKKVTTVQQQYTITLTASPTEGGKVTGADTYYDGTSVTIKATANEGYAFSRWSDGDTNASRTIVANKNYSLTAYFTKKEATKQYTVILTASPAEGGRVTGAGTFDEGETILIRAIANAGYQFTKWSDNYTSESRNLTVDKDYSLTAYFEKATDPDNPGGGSDNPGGGSDNPDNPGGGSDNPIDGMLGDVNNDNVVDQADVEYIKEVYLGRKAANNRCDVDRDGKVSVADVTIVIAIANGTYDGGNGGNDNPQTDSHEYVDLGLPSGTLWATCNLGANSPEELGDYFAWGETEPKDTYSDGNYTGTSNGSELGSDSDAATANWGTNWRIPSVNEYKELINPEYTTITESTVNGINGIIIQSRQNGNKIFMPHTECFIPTKANYSWYWSNSKMANTSLAYFLNTKDIPSGMGSATVPSYGLSVRPVYVKPKTDTHEYVDLGLPSGKLWATCNIGANSPEEYGDYFAWGETETKSYFHESNYKFYNSGNKYSINKYCWNSEYGVVDGKVELDKEDDAACVNWGGHWSMPTYADFDELRKNCTWENTTLNGVAGLKITGPTGKSIFIPASGAMPYWKPGTNCFFWTKSASDVHACYNATAAYNRASLTNERQEGMPIRPIYIK